jgi:hypothetical protein
MVHLAPIPEIPVQMLNNPKMAEVDWLLELVDTMLEDSANRSTVFTKGDFKQDAQC